VFVTSLGAADTKPPNIVFIFSDDHAYQAVSAYGHPLKLNQTPNIDRIAKGGMRFDRCLIPNSICGPSRACILTGKYNHMNRFYDNSRSKFDGTQVTFPKLLQKAGYQTAIIGKWHLVSDPTGFDHWHILPGQGIYYNPPMIKNGVQARQTGYTTDVITDLSLDWLKNRDKTKPFLLMCQHKAPHREWAPALRHLGHDQDRNYPEPDTLFDDYAGRGKAEKNQDMTLEKTFTPLDAKLRYPAGLTDAEKKEWDKYYQPRNEAFTKANLSGKELVRWRYNRYLHDYLGCIKAVDEGVGKILDYLDQDGLSDNTIVVYMADQGFYLGEHGWFDKRWIFEESLRTPCLIRWPGVTKPGSTTNVITSNIDWAPTFLAAAGVPVPAEIQGRDMKGVLKGEPPADWRKSFYYHYYEYPGPHSVAKHYGVVTDRYKLVRFYEKEFDYWELFDREKDPKELVSFYGKAEYATVQKELETELARLRKELKVPDPDPPETDLRKR
jgi:arylsulfatase A-like enzyme